MKADAVAGVSVIVTFVTEGDPTAHISAIWVGPISEDGAT
jgi:hypothetical protein